jgi:hypothetical protein
MREIKEYSPAKPRASRTADIQVIGPAKSILHPPNDIGTWVS